MAHRVTFVCDGCETQFMVDESMDIPPHWLAAQIAISDKEGMVPNQERDIFLHFCKRECVMQYVSGAKLRERLCLVDRDYDDDDDGAEDAQP